MKPRIILNDFEASLKSHFRSKGTLFWSIAFPVLFILLFGAIFSGGTGSYDLYVKNYDYENGEMIANFLRNDTAGMEFLGNFTNFYDAIYEQFNKTRVTKIKIIGDEAKNDEQLQKYISEHRGKVKSILIIPKNYGLKLGFALAEKNASYAENLTLLLDPSEPERNNVIMAIVSKFVDQSNLFISGGKNFIHFNQSSIIQKRYEFIDFFVPGIIGMSVMMSGVYGSIERNTKFRKNGILRKISTTPFTRSEWILAKMLFMVFLAFISTSVILLVGIIVWGVAVEINVWVFILVVSASFAFSGLGMIVTRFVKEEETADSAGGAITFPMMFLAGTFFPLEMMPPFLQAIAKILPLYYVNEGLRDAMILGDASGALWNSIIVLIFTAVVFTLGVLLTSWKEE